MSFIANTTDAVSFYVNLEDFTECKGTFLKGTIYKKMPYGDSFYLIDCEGHQILDIDHKKLLVPIGEVDKLFKSIRC